jgi:hypothetical protein
VCASGCWAMSTIEAFGNLANVLCTSYGVCRDSAGCTCAGREGAGGKHQGAGPDHDDMLLLLSRATWPALSTAWGICQGDAS